MGWICELHRCGQSSFFSQEGPWGYAEFLVAWTVQECMSRGQYRFACLSLYNASLVKEVWAWTQTWKNDLVDSCSRQTQTRGIHSLRQGKRSYVLLFQLLAQEKAEKERATKYVKELSDGLKESQAERRQLFKLLDRSVVFVCLPFHRDLVWVCSVHMQNDDISRNCFTCTCAVLISRGGSFAPQSFWYACACACMCVRVCVCVFEGFSRIRAPCDFQMDLIAFMETDEICHKVSVSKRTWLQRTRCFEKIQWRILAGV